MMYWCKIRPMRDYKHSKANTMKKNILIILLGTILLSACEKIDLTDGYVLPEGYISGKLVWEGSNTIAPDYYVLFTNEDNGNQDFSFSRSDGTFDVNRMDAANYSLTIFNDSIITVSEIAFTLSDGEQKDLGDIAIKVAPYPELSVSMVSSTTSSITIRVDVNENGNAIRTRGTTFLPASDPLDVREEGTYKSQGYPPQLDFWEQTISGLDPDTEYKLRARVIIYRGITATGSNKQIKIFSEEKIFSTAAN